jgi:hypothetical protein
LLLSAPKQIGLRKIKNLFENNFAPLDVTSWINSVQEETVEMGPIKELLETIYDLQVSDTEPPEIASVRISLNQKIGCHLSIEKIKSILESLKTFVPGFIDINDRYVGIQGSPTKVMGVISSQISTVPRDLQQQYIDAFTK